MSRPFGRTSPRIQPELPLKNNNNKLLRAQLRSRTRNSFGTGDTKIAVDDQLTRLEEDIRRLKIEFDIYFNGASKRPPYDTKGRVETVLKRIGDDRSLSFAERYRYNTLMSRYNAFRDLWRRTMLGREEGRDVASAARASAKRVAVENFTRTTLVCEDANKEVETVKHLYDALVDAKAKCGESTEDFSFPRFHRLIASKADVLKKKMKCARVSFSVDVEGGHVSFKARAERD